MRDDGGRRGVLLLAILIAVALSVSLYATQFTISDSDPSTYVIIPMLMLPVFALFFMKQRIRPHVRRHDAIIGVLLFAALVVLTAFLHVSLSYQFLSYRVDMLLFPLLIAALVISIFGLRNLGKFWPLMLYAIFASPLLLMPVISLNPWFASVNTQIVYHMLSAFIPGAVYSAPITIVANGYRIGIGESCVGVGLLIAVVLLLAPVAYVYDGSLRRKAFWIASGLLILFLLNLLRMFLIAGLWVSSGPDSALALFHSVAGMLLFYAVVIAMILVSSFYRIGIRRKSGRKSQNGLAQYNYIGVAASIFITLGYVALNSGLSSQLYVSPYLSGIAQQPGASAMMHVESALSNTAYMFGIVLNSSSSGFTMELYNKTNTSITINSPVLLYSVFGNSSGAIPTFSNSTTADGLSFISDGGITQYVYYVISNGTPFVFYRAAVPMAFNSSYAVATFYAIVPANDLESEKCNGSYSAYSTILNGVDLRFYNGTVTKALAAGECIIGGAVLGSV